jgi:LPS export ABC transporter protein LptC
MQKLNKIRQLLALTIVVASVSLVVAIILKVTRLRGPAEVLPRLAKNVDVSLQKIHYTETKQGVKQWDLVADKVEYDKGREITSLAGIRLVVAGNGQTGDITLTADRGEFFNQSKDVQLSGNVVARSASGMEFTTSQATYRADRSMIESSARVRFTDGKLTLEGVGMELMTVTKNLRIQRDVTADIRPGAGR